MKKFEDDRELRELIKSIHLDKPAPDFARHVMNSVFQERNLIEQVKAEPVLKIGFWIILALFGVLFAAMMLLSGSSPAAETYNLLPDVGSQEFMNGYRSFFERLGSLPASLAGISMGFSLLIFLERYLSSKRTDLV